MLLQRLVVAGLLMCACGPQLSEPVLDASVVSEPRDGGELVALDAGTDAGLSENRDAGVDAGMTSSDAGPAATDGGCVRILPALVVCPRPPAGTTPCGTGEFTTATTRPACDALDTSTVSMRPPKDCAALSGISGHYEAYCGPTHVYLWVAVETVTSDAVMPCTSIIPLPDGGMITRVNHQLRWGINAVNVGRRSALVTPELADGGGSRVELLDQTIPRRQLDSPPFTNDPARWTGSFALESSFRLTDRVRTTGEFVVPASPVDCHQVATSGVSTVLLTVPFAVEP